MAGFRLQVVELPEEELAEVLAQSISGKSLPQIAVDNGYPDEKVAREILCAALRLPREAPVSLIEKEVELRRLDKLWSIALTKAETDKDAPAIRAALDISTQRQKLLGIIPRESAESNQTTITRVEITVQPPSGPTSAHPFADDARKQVVEHATRTP